MNIFIHFLWILIYCLSISRPMEGNSYWLDNLHNYLQNDRHMSQVVILDSKSCSSDQKHFLFQEIISKYPSIVFNDVSHEDEGLIKGRPIAARLFIERSTLIIGIYCSRNTTSLTKSLIKHFRYITSDFFSMESGGTFPYFLSVIIRPAAAIGYEVFIKTILETVCPKKYAYFTLLELSETSTLENSFLLSMTKKHPEYNAVIHQYNPFKRKYSSQIISSQIEWFPDKCRDVNGAKVFLRLSRQYELFLGLGPSPNNLKAIHSSRETEGPYASILKTLEIAFNFTLLYVSKDYEKLKIVYPDCAISFREDPQLGFGSEGTKTTFIKPCKVVPIFPIQRVTMLSTPNTFKLYIFSTIGSIIAVYLVSRAVKWKNTFWKPTEIFYAILGIGVARMPTNVSERFLCTAVLITSIVYGVNIIESLMDVKMLHNVEKKIVSFEDLFKENLRPLVTGREVNHYMMRDIPILRKLDRTRILLRDKGFYQHFYSFLNLTLNNSNTNIFTFVDEYQAKVATEVYKKLNGEKFFDYLGEQDVFFGWSYIMMPRGSPLVHRINILLRRLQESGIMKRWFETELIYAEIAAFKYLKRDKSCTPTSRNDECINSGGSTRFDVSDDVSKDLISKLIFVSALSYAFCLVVLLGEIFFYRYKNGIIMYLIRLKIVKVINRYRMVFQRELRFSR